jgi:hypothetical protein
METAERARDRDDPAVFDWRFQELCRAGYAPSDAWVLASARHADLRLAERLLRAGCPPATALRILI